MVAQVQGIALTSIIPDAAACSSDDAAESRKVAA
jgi:hypothetical protein